MIHISTIKCEHMWQQQDGSVLSSGYLFPGLRALQSYTAQACVRADREWRGVTRVSTSAQILDPGLTANLLASYGRLDDLMHYATLRQARNSSLCAFLCEQYARLINLTW